VPTKAAYLAFEADPGLEFEHFLCLKIGGMTVEEMRERMSTEEFLRWSIYYAREAQRAELKRRQAGV
jgi:hypothetical protein